jgi:receptor-binding and translocation channel-forming TcA subunit of Tc toxin
MSGSRTPTPTSSVELVEGKTLEMYHTYGLPVFGPGREAPGAALRKGPFLRHAVLPTHPTWPPHARPVQVLRCWPACLRSSISRWRIELPIDTNAFDFNTLADVVLHLKYTAREGGAILRNAASMARSSFGLVLAYPKATVLGGGTISVFALHDMRFRV